MSSPAYAAWAEAEAFVEAAEPQFIILQCGADSVAGDPLTHLRYTPAAHGHAAAAPRHAAAAPRRVADRHAGGRLLGLGGGGYDLANLAAAWLAVTRALLD